MPYRYRTNVDFDSLINSALGLIDEQQQQKLQEQTKYMQGIKKDLIKMMHEGRWLELSRYRYDHPDLAVWISELEYSYWSQRDALNSHWQQ